MKWLVAIEIVVVLFIISCKTGPSLFGKKTLHEKYGESLIKAGLQETALGRQWFAAADQALADPKMIVIPYKELGYFPADRPLAAGIKFSARRGQKLLFRLEKNPLTGFVIYTELWQVAERGRPALVASIDTSAGTFDYEVEKDGSFILRLQPELLKSGEYTLSISIGPSMAFPVATRSARIASFWGDSRDNGGRKHEGIDIFAPRGTPVIAVADGRVSSVTENNLGGKVIFMRPRDKNFSLYYAHLEEQLVSSGQLVQLGDTLGLVGNTGNARTTPPHLHFGIYTSQGAIDPLGFVNPEIQKPLNVEAEPDKLKVRSRLNAPVAVGNKTYKAGTLLVPLSVNAKNYRMQFPDGKTADVPVSRIESAASLIGREKTERHSFLYESPDSTKPRIEELTASSTVGVLGYFGDFAFVRTKTGTQGWVPVDRFK